MSRHSGALRGWRRPARTKGRDPGDPQPGSRARFPEDDLRRRLSGISADKRLPIFLHLRRIVAAAAGASRLGRREARGTARARRTCLSRRRRAPPIIIPIGWCRTGATRSPRWRGSAPICSTSGSDQRRRPSLRRGHRHIRAMFATNADLFDAPILPGLAYRDDAVTAGEEAALIASIDAQPLSPVPLPGLGRQTPDRLVRLVL